MLVQPGDIVCVTDLSPNGYFDKMLGKLIVGVTNARSADGHSEFRHALMITNENGETFEAVGKYERKNLFTDYKGYKIIIGRHKDMKPDNFQYALKIVTDKYEGKRYPWYRLFTHGSTAFARWTPMVKPVCSELTRITTLLAGCRDYQDQHFEGMWTDPIGHYEWAHKKAKSYTPDNQADWIRGADLWDVVYYGDFT